MSLSVQQTGPRFSASESITVSTVAKTLTAATIAGRSHALITVETASIRFWLDGSTPTASVGHIADDGDVIELSDPKELENFKAIRKDGTDATLRCSYGG